MIRFDEPNSILAPLIVAAPADAGRVEFGKFLKSAALGIPSVAPVRKVMKYSGFGFGNADRRWDRFTIVLGAGGSGDFYERVILVERPDVSDIPTKVAKTCPDRVLWDVVVSGLNPELVTPAVPPEYSAAWLQVRGFCISGFGAPGAAELALLRHRFAACVRSVSAASIVFGGQHEWRDEWWTEVAPPAERVAR